MNSSPRRFTPIHCRRFGVVLLLAVLLLGQAAPAGAQDEEDNRLWISAPILEQFPTISLYLEAYDAGGAFITGLTQDEVRILEDGLPRPLERLERIEPGLQFTVAISAGPMMANTVKGVTSYAQIQQVLMEWAQAQPSDTPGHFSLATNQELLASHLTDPQEWAQALADYQPDLMSEQASLTPLSLALDQASDSMPNPLMKHAILYITAPPNAAVRAALPNLASRAAQLGVRVFVWLVAPPQYANAPVAEPLIELAASSGGQFLTFSGLESLPALNDLLQPLRYRYRVDYLSAIRQSGVHRLSLEVRRPELQAVSPEQSFQIEVLPPRPVFLAPPAEINRVWRQPAETRGSPQLLPDSVPIQMLVEFPDGYERPLKSARLYVDGALATENTQPPFDRFEWDLSAYTQSSQHQLQLEVQDHLGLKQTSILIPVQVQVEVQAKNWWEGLFNLKTLPIFAGLLLAVLALALVWRRAGRRWLNPAEARKLKQRYKDPVTQPVAIRQEKRLKPFTGSAASALPRLMESADAPAHLVPVSENGEPRPGQRIALNRSEITFGRDPAQAICVLESPTVSDLHARLVQTPEGGFILADAGSVAGTWVNYTPVSSRGVRLMHGDLIHFGRVAMRFELKKAGERRKITLTPNDEDGI